MRKITRRGLKKKLDILVKEFVKKRDNYTCQKCGKRLESSNCHGSHVIPVSAGIRWAYDPDNIITLCFHDHINWWHKNPLESGEWFKKTFPKMYKHIEEVKPSRKPGPFKDFQLAELYEELKAILDK